jgi:hypothetical protein
MAKIPEEEEPKVVGGLSGREKVILGIVLVGFVGAVALYWARMPPIIPSVFLAAGVASLVYAFLGGIEEQTGFGIGPLKMGGSIAALLGAAWFINGELAQQTGLDLRRDIEPPLATWFAMDIGRGVPVAVSIGGVANAIPLPPRDALENNPLELRRDGEHWHSVPEADSTFMLGTLESEDLRRSGLFNVIEEEARGFFVTGRLAAFSESVPLGPLPFRLSTLEFAGEYSGYRLSGPEGAALYEGRIYRRQAQIVNVGGRYYLVAVVEVNHELQEGQDPYAKFAVGEIRVALTP